MAEKTKVCRNCRYCVLRYFGLAFGTQSVNNYQLVNRVHSSQFSMCMHHGIHIPNPNLYVCDDWEGFANGKDILRKAEE